jgi:hypothetical protein
MSMKHREMEPEEYHQQKAASLSVPVRVSSGPIPNVAKDPFRLDWNTHYARAARVLQDKFRNGKSLGEFIAFVDEVEKLA